VYLTKNDLTVRTHLGERSPTILESDAVDSTQSQRWSFMTVIYICVCSCYERS
jgi:hypothetical protein